MEKNKMKKVYITFLSIFPDEEIIGYRTKKEAQAALDAREIEHATIIKVRIKKKKNEKNN